MQVITSLKAQNQFGQLLNTSQREPVVVTRHSQPISAVISVSGSASDMRRQFEKLLSQLKPLRGADAVAAFTQATESIQNRAAEDGITEVVVLQILND